MEPVNISMTQINQCHLKMDQYTVIIYSGTSLIRIPDKGNQFWPSVGVRINEVLLYILRT